MEKRLTVTAPLLPPLSELVPYLEDIWKRKWITNMGHYHEALEEALCEYLDVPFISLFTNGTLPLMIALRALDIQGEVITTPYSFVATAHALWWNGVTPVFTDVDPATCNMDPAGIEAAITPRTTAIMPVHVYGNPCDTERIQAIAGKYNLKVIYDAAHTFGVTANGASVLKAGHLSTLSFHATKVFNTIEGGALVCHDRETKERIDYLKNFGFTGETTVETPGINGKMDEVRAAYGLAALKYVDEAIDLRRQVAIKYREGLRGIPGISFLEEAPEQQVRRNYSYFPVFIDEEEYGLSRDGLYARMQERNIFGRRYFYPLITSFSPYCNFPSGGKDKLPHAHRVADSVICLPIHHELAEADAERVIRVITESQTNKKQPYNGKAVIDYPML